MKIVIPGGSGQVGTMLGWAFAGEGHEVVELSRDPDEAGIMVNVWPGSPPP